jgi:hypothetical protein
VTLQTPCRATGLQLARATKDAKSSRGDRRELNARSVRAGSVGILLSRCKHRAKPVKCEADDALRATYPSRFGKSSIVSGTCSGATGGTLAASLGSMQTCAATLAPKATMPLPETDYFVDPITGERLGDPSTDPHGWTMDAEGCEIVGEDEETGDVWWGTLDAVWVLSACPTIHVVNGYRYAQAYTGYFRGTGEEAERYARCHGVKDITVYPGDE